MNFNRILVFSFLILLISTYQTVSGIILGLLLKHILLKEALFMSMPLTLGSFIMGQGMGLFAGNMLGGMMMLRTANRYHNQEKSKWMGYGNGALRPTYTPPISSGGSSGYGHDPNYQAACEKGRAIASALYNLKAHRLKIKSVLSQLKAKFGLHKLIGLGGGGGYPGHSISYKPPPGYQYSEPAAYHKSKGWGWASSSDSSGGYESGGYESEQDHYHGSQSKPEVVSMKYQLIPYDKYKEMTTGKGDDYDGSASSKEESHKSPEGQRTPRNYFLPGYVPDEPSSPHESASTYYTSVYGGPGHEDTGILTQSQRESPLQDLAQDKSPEKSRFLVYDAKSPPMLSESEKFATLSPNLLEKYLDKRLEESSDKQTEVKEIEGTQQLIQILRNTYLRQLITSFKEEETLVSGSNEITRDSRSIEDSDKQNLIRNILLRNMQMSKKPSGSKMDDHNSDSVNEINELMLQSPPDPITSLEIPEISSTENLIMSNPAEFAAIPPRAISKKPTKSTREPFSSSENDVRETDNDVSGTESPVTSSVKSPSQTVGPSSVFKIPKPETARDFERKKRTMWAQADETLSKEAFSIRDKRNAAEEAEGDEALYDETKTQAKGDTSTQPTMPVETEKQIHAFVDDIKKFFTLLTVLDQDQCLQKLVCDVHTKQKDISTITQYEQNILTTFKLMKTLMPPGEEDSSTKYRQAALIGETGQSLELCQQTFSPCRYSSSQIITLGTQIEATPTDWGEAGVPSSQATLRRSD